MDYKETLLAEGVARLLEIKDSDIRLLVLHQGATAIDRGVHIGGANSVVIPLVSLFYGGIIDVDVEQPTRPGQDQFVLSKGHAVATMAGIYADLGYFDESVLENSRSMESILNGHPGPVLPGVQIATGPLGQGVAVAQGFAMAGMTNPAFNVFAVTGDGELQEGVAWEAIMHAPARRLSNLCVIVDKNEGQLDDHTHLLFPMDRLGAQFDAFGWRTLEVDGTDYRSVWNALRSFVSGPRDGRPTAIICNTRKGYGSASAFLNRHKVTIPDDVNVREVEQQRRRRRARVADYFAYERRLAERGEATIIEELRACASGMNLRLDEGTKTVEPGERAVRTRRADSRDKQIRYDATMLPRLDPADKYEASAIVRNCMQVFAEDGRVVSVDADLSSTSGLQSGVGHVDQTRAINAGIAESNMMCIGEAYAALGYNAWVSTFCPFFDWKVLRRIAVGQQERLEDIASSDGWLSEGHGLDLTFLATAPNFETKTNGATHMGNDDTIVFGGIAGLKIIDVSCPNQLIGVMKWIMEGNRGLCYVRIMRSASAVLYPDVPAFEFGRAWSLRGSADSGVHLVSSGRGVHELMAAADILAGEGIDVEVIDMPSIDADLLADRLAGAGRIVIAEQNNGYIWNEAIRVAAERGIPLGQGKLVAINARTEQGAYQFIHSATYGQLLDRFGLTPEQIARRVSAT